MFLAHRLAVPARLHGVIMQRSSVGIFNDICLTSVTAVKRDR